MCACLLYSPAVSVTANSELKNNEETAKYLTKWKSWKHPLHFSLDRSALCVCVKNCKYST